MTELKTWGGRSRFKYDGSVLRGTTIYFGKKSKVSIQTSTYQALLNGFHQCVVTVGTSRTDERAGSLGEWLKDHVTRTAIASYVASILLSEGYGERVDHVSIYLRKGVRAKAQ